MTRTDPQTRAPLTQREHPGHTVTACVQQWQDAELAMTVARRCFQTWFQTSHQDTPTSATMHAYHTHEALHEARHAISRLIETLRVQVAAGDAQA